MIIKPKSPHQEPLDFRMDEKGSFSTFVSGKNAPMIAALKEAASKRENELFYFFGPKGCGKTHLLTAIFHMLDLTPNRVFFVDMTLAKALSPLLLTSTEVPEVIMLDNVDAVAGDDQWELALFGLYNRWVDQQDGIFIATAHTSADRIPFNMPDLNTRFENGISYPMELLDEAECAEALQLRSRVRGMNMPRKVASYMIRHLNCDMPGLMRALDVLDKATLQEQHDLTVPFVKKILQHARITGALTEPEPQATAGV